MNVFYLHEDPKICAEMHLDKHCVKMLVEYAQLMCTAHRVLDGTPWEQLIVTKHGRGRKIKRWNHPTRDYYLYKATMVNHPTNVWLRQSKENYEWLYKMWLCLHKEYQNRYGKYQYHKSVAKLKSILKNPPANIPDVPFTEPAQAMPDDVKNDCTVTAYRDYYIKYKKGFAEWKTTTPTWFTEGINANLHI